MCDTCPKERRRPQDRQDQDRVNRRGFVGMLLATSASFALASVPLAFTAVAQAEGEERARLKPGPKVAVARVADVPEGKALNFSYPDKDHPAILVHLPSGEFRAFDASCTHLGCPVYWDPNDVQLKCPCHKGFFDPASGDALSGPPRRPLVGIALSVEDGIIYATGRFEP